MAKKSGLGRGMDSIFVDNAVDTGESSGTTMLRLAKIEPNPDQPRREFDKEALEQLADSIREAGVLSPILVVEDGVRYRIVAG